MSCHLQWAHTSYSEIIISVSTVTLKKAEEGDGEEEVNHCDSLLIQSIYISIPRSTAADMP